MAFLGKKLQSTAGFVFLLTHGGGGAAPQPIQGRDAGGALSVRAPALPPAFHTLAKGIYLDRGATLFYTGTKAMHYLILPIINIPAPPSKNHPVAPLLNSNPFICNMI